MVKDDVTNGMCEKVAETRPAPPRIEALVFMIMLCSFSYFFHPALYDNALSRLDLTYAIVYESRAEIDSYHTNTLDKAFFNGHYYSDKAPGLSFAAVPVLAAARNIFKFKDTGPASPLPAHILTFFVISLPAALCFMLLFRMVRVLSGSDACATAVTVFTSIGTICLPYSTQFYGHMFAGALLIAALYLVLMPDLQGRARSSAALFFTGFLLGAAFISDYPSALPAAMIALYALAGPSRARTFLLIAAGASLPAAALLVYNNSLFGTPFAIGYFKEVSPYYKEGMSRGVGGVTLPSPIAFLKLLFAPQRGLFWGSPFLLFVFPAVVMIFRAGTVFKRAALLCAACFASILLVNSAYYEPYGGFAPGPRFLAGAIPFLAIVLGAAWPHFSSRVKIAFVSAGCVSVAVNFLLNAVEPHVPHVFSAPVLQFAMPLLESGFLYDNVGTVLFGLHGVLSYVPLLMFVAITSFILFRLTSRDACSVSNVIVFLLVFVSAAAAYFVAGHLTRAPRERDYYISETWVRRGLVYYRSGDAFEAERSFISAIESHPNWPQPYISLSALYIAAGKPDSAVPVLKRAMQLGYNKDVKRLLDTAAGKGATTP